jgi:competence protein ComEC
MENRMTPNLRTGARRGSTALLPLVLLACSLAPARMVRAQSGTLDIYVIDVEGGGGTLVVSPAGESLLIDAGFPRPDDRDAKRIYTVTQAAGLKKIDYFLLTHFHGDHVGGLPALAKMIPVGRFFAHGGTVDQRDQASLDAYNRASEKGNRTTLKLGDEIPLKGVTVQVISANMAYQAELLGGSEPNPFCEGAEHKAADLLENQRNIATLLTYGRFKFLNPGDMPWERELELACPVNKLGTVTIYQTSKHGAWDGGGAPAFVNAIRPQVVLVNNGAAKGLGIPAGRGHYERMTKIPGVEGIWQVHMSPEGPAHNSAESMIANLDKDSEHTQVHWIKASIRADGGFTVTNSRNEFSRTYMTR